MWTCAKLAKARQVRKEEDLSLSSLAPLASWRTWRNWRERSQDPFTRVEEHVLLGMASDPRDADARLQPLLDDQALRTAIHSVPDAWLEPVDSLTSPDEQREAYFVWLTERLHGSCAWLDTATEAWRKGPITYSRRLTHRVV